MDTFRDIDVGQIVKDNHSKKNGNGNQDTNNLR